MTPFHLSVRCSPCFPDLSDEIRQACLAPESWKIPAQVTYLQSYLQRGDARGQTLVIEHPYVDRHYMEEFSAYYATALRLNRPHSTRIHVFTSDFDDAQFGQWLREAATNGARDVERRLNEKYLGFITVRPIPSAPIGRTILRPYGDVAAREYAPARTRHQAHLLGLRLEVQGLPFQQQDQAVGACATTALWSALARTIRSDGGRAPTPFSVTRAATKHYLADRVVPAVSGLDLYQIAAAIRDLGYSPYVLKAHQSFSTFLLSLKCYLASGIPAVLILAEGTQNHAVAVSGFRESDSDAQAGDIVISEGSTHLAATGVTRLYVHDDRFGPYVRMALSQPEEGQDSPILERIPISDSDGIDVTKSRVNYAVFPLYPKLRLTAKEMIALAGELVPFLRYVLQQADLSLRIDVRFALSGDYVRGLNSSGIDPARVEAFARQAVLPRYVGRIRFFIADGALADVICDTTDIAREVPQFAPILAMIPFVDKSVPTFKEYARQSMPWALVV